LGQRYTRSGALLTLGASGRIATRVGRVWAGYVFRAWRRGRSAVHLTALPYEQLLPLPLASVRRAARVEEPQVAHPGGVLYEPSLDSTLET